MTSLPVVPRGVVTPRFLTVPPARKSAGREAVELAARAGLHLDEWQALGLEHALAESSDGRWAAFEVAFILPRQNGKGSILEALELAGLFLLGERLILHSAHEFKTAVEAFRRVLALIQDTPELDRHVAKVRTAHGAEGIELRSGARLNFVARSRGSGRGFSGDRIILDEAYDLSDAAMSALLPTMSARSMDVPGPQIVYTSSAPLPDERSDVLRRLMRRGREGSERLAYMEWSAVDDAKHDDEESVAQANPALGIRITSEFVSQERRILSSTDFARERLGIVDLDVFTSGPITEAAWAACCDQLSGPGERLAFALDVSFDRGSASFAVASESVRGGVHLELVDHRPGTHWLVGRAKEIQAQWGGAFAIGVGSPAWSLEPDLREAGVELVEVPTAEHAQACGSLADAVIERSVRHRGDPDLVKAVAGAAAKPYGDAWLWGRRLSGVDISPLVAVTLARWALVSVEQPVLCAF